MVSVCVYISAHEIPIGFIELNTLYNIKTVKFFETVTYSIKAFITLRKNYLHVVVFKFSKYNTQATQHILYSKQATHLRIYSVRFMYPCIRSLNLK